MSLIPESVFEPLREAQDQINVRLEEMLVELRAIHLLLREQGVTAHAPTSASTAA